MKKTPLQGSRRPLAALLAAIGSFNFIGSVLSLLLEAIFSPHAAEVFDTTNFIHSFVYANCIGTFVGIGVGPRSV